MSEATGAPYEDPTYTDDALAFRWGCVLGGRCLIPDKHYSSECRSAEEMDDTVEMHYSGLERMEDAS